MEIGADDYLAKPFHLAELMARIKSVIRRKNQDGENVITYKNINIYPENRKVLINGEELVLNRKEYDLLYYFVIQPQKTLQKATLAEAIWEIILIRRTVLILSIRKLKIFVKLKTSASEADFQAVYGIGYKLI